MRTLKQEIRCRPTWRAFPQCNYRRSCPSSGQIFESQNLMTSSPWWRENPMLAGRLIRSGTCPALWSAGGIRGCNSSLSLPQNRSCTRRHLCSSPTLAWNLKHLKKYQVLSTWVRIMKYSKFLQRISTMTSQYSFEVDPWFLTLQSVFSLSSHSLLL